jgi:hypothetical protein
MPKLLFIIIPAIAFAAYVIGCVLAAAFPFSDAGLELDFLRSGEAFFPSALAFYLVLCVAAHAALGWTPARSGLVALAIVAAWAAFVYMGAIGRAITGAGGGHPGSPGALEDAFFLPERLVVKPIEALTAPLRRRNCVQALAGPYRSGAQEELCRVGVRSLSADVQLALIRRLQEDAAALASQASPGGAELEASRRLRSCLLEVPLDAPEVLRHLTSAATDAALDERAREAAIGMLGRAGARKAELLSTLLALASEDRSPAIRRAALEAAFELAPGDARLEPACLAAVARGDAAGALGLRRLDPRDRRVARAYAEHLRSADPAVRLAWLRTLPTGDQADAFARATLDGYGRRIDETLTAADPADFDLRRALRDALLDPDADVVCAAAQATVQIFPDADAGKAVTQLLGHPSPQVREVAAGLVARRERVPPDDRMFDALLAAMAESSSTSFGHAVARLLEYRPPPGWRPSAVQLARIVRLGARRPERWRELGYRVENATGAFRDQPAPALEEALADALSSPAVEQKGEARVTTIRFRTALASTARRLGHRQERLQLALAGQIAFGEQASPDAPEPDYDVSRLRDEAARTLRELRPHPPSTVARLEALAASADRDVARNAQFALKADTDDR